MKAETEEKLAYILALVIAGVFWFMVTVILIFSFPQVIFLAAMLYLWVKIEDTSQFLVLEFMNHLRTRRKEVANERSKDKPPLD